MRGSTVYNNVILVFVIIELLNVDYIINISKNCVNNNQCDHFGL